MFWFSAIWLFSPHSHPSKCSYIHSFIHRISQSTQDRSNECNANHTLNHLPLNNRWRKPESAQTDREASTEPRTWCSYERCSPRWFQNGEATWRLWEAASWTPTNEPTMAQVPQMKGFRVGEYIFPLLFRWETRVLQWCPSPKEPWLEES